jgi:N-acetylglutamate synthase-like GNAT family acetyltransferase
MITYRQAALSDASQVLALLVEIMEDHGVTPPEPERLAATISSILTAPDHSFLVAESHGHPVGMCALVFSLSTWSASPVCELQDLVVTRSHRRGHVGRGLAQTAESIAQARGCSRLFLMAESWNLDAHSFYRGLGLAEKTCLYFERDLPAELR